MYRRRHESAITVTAVKYFTPFVARLKIISVQFEVIGLVQI